MRLSNQANPDGRKMGCWVARRDHRVHWSKGISSLNLYWERLLTGEYSLTLLYLVGICLSGSPIFKGVKNEFSH